MAFLSLLLLLVGFLVFLCFDNVGGGGGVVVDMEEEELFGLFEVMGSLLEDPTWAQMHPSPCTDTPWPGVECELLDQEQKNSVFHVTKIHVGPDVTTPPCKPSAQISQSLLKLPYLKTLSLMNCFTKSPVFLTKPLFESLSSLEHLAIDSNPTLSGEIPSTISNLANLNTLCLSQNNLSGEIPEEITALVKLQQLDLSHNNLTGSIPEGIGALQELAILDMSWNSLQGKIPPSIGGLQFLEKIDLSSNKLRGSPPNELGELKRLVLLDLSHNSLTGPIPESLSGSTQLQYLIMEDNPLNATLPSFTGSLTKLTVLSFSRCGLTGPIPTTLSNLTALTALSLDNNRLSGTVPPELGRLASMDLLNLSRNELSGEVLFPQDFIVRLGRRLDIRENRGLCINQDAEITTSSPACSSAVFPAATNKTFAGKNPGRAENMKPKLYKGNNERTNNDSGSKSCRFSGLVFLLFVVVSLWFLGL